jgi:hypothetical protein
VVRRACCPERGSLSALASLSEPEWLPAQVSRDGPRALPSEQAVSPWAQARAARREPLPEAAAEVMSDEPQAAAGWACAAEPLRAASEPALPRAVREAAVSGHAAAEPRPEATTAASVRQAVVVAAAPGAPQGAAEAAQLGAAVRPRAAARRADGEVQPRAAVQPGARVPQAVRPLAVPSAAASVFRQGPCLAAGPARPRAVRRLAHAMRCWPIASR